MKKHLTFMVLLASVALTILHGCNPNAFQSNIQGQETNTIYSDEYIKSINNATSTEIIVNEDYFIFNNSFDMEGVYKYDFETQSTELLIDKMVACIDISDHILYFSLYEDEEIYKLDIGNNDCDVVVSLNCSNILIADDFMFLSDSKSNKTYIYNFITEEVDLFYSGKMTNLFSYQNDMYFINAKGTLCKYSEDEIEELVTDVQKFLVAGDIIYVYTNFSIMAYSYPDDSLRKIAGPQIDGVTVNTGNCVTLCGDYLVYNGVENGKYKIFTYNLGNQMKKVIYKGKYTCLLTSGDKLIMEDWNSWTFIDPSTGKDI